jgi:hypothetical protein
VLLFAAKSSPAHVEIIIKQRQTAMNIIAALLGSFLLFVCITTSILFCYYKKSFKFYSTKDRFEKMQQLIISQQKQIEAQGETFQKTQYSAIQSPYGINFPIIKTSSIHFEKLFLIKHGDTFLLCLYKHCT